MILPNHWLKSVFLRPIYATAIAVRRASIPSSACHSMRAAFSAASRAASAASGWAAIRFSSCLRHTLRVIHIGRRRAARSSRRSCRRRHTSRAGRALFPGRCAAPATRRHRKPPAPPPACLRWPPDGSAGSAAESPAPDCATPDCGSIPCPRRSRATDRSAEPHPLPARPSTPFSSHMLASTARRSSPSSRRMPKRRQVGGKRLHVMVVVLRILAQIVAGQLARRPRLVKRMAEQVILRDARVQLLEEFRGIHEAPLGVR